MPSNDPTAPVGTAGELLCISCDVYYPQDKFEDAGKTKCMQCVPPKEPRPPQTDPNKPNFDAKEAAKQVASKRV